MPNASACLQEIQKNSNRNKILNNFDDLMGQSTPVMDLPVPNTNNVPAYILRFGTDLLNDIKDLHRNHPTIEQLTPTETFDTSFRAGEIYCRRLTHV